MSFTKVAPAGIGTEPGSTIRLGDSLLHSTGLDIGVGSGIGVTIRQHGDATFTGIITASAFFGDGSGLEGVSSSGIGTALNDDDTNILNKIYYVNQELSIGSTVTVNHPDTGTASYTHYQDLVVKDDADFIVADGDTFIPDILGITTSTLAASAATGGRIRAGTLTNAGANGAPNFPNGVTGTSATFTTGTITGNLNVGGVLKYEDVTNVDSVGLITARAGIRIGGGTTVGPSSGIVTYFGDGSQLTGITGTTINNNANNRVITGSGTANTLEGENHFQFNPSNSGNAQLTVTAPEGGSAEFHLNADENDDMFDRYKLVSGADNHFQMYQMGAGGGWESRFKLHSERGNPEFIHDPIGLYGGGVVIAQANTNSGSSSDSPNFKVDFTVPSADISTIKRDGAREGFNSSTETGSYISPSGASGILIASCFGNYYWGFATKIYHISIYGSYGNNSDRAVSLNQLHSYSAAGHGSSNAHITLSVQSIPNNQKYTPKLRATFGGDYWSSNYLVVTYVGSGVASYANLRALSHINSEITGQDTAWK